jgi:exopolysaccharide biosynthesis polyprenyl glycosylphosphotransferase
VRRLRATVALNGKTDGPPPAEAFELPEVRPATDDVRAAVDGRTLDIAERRRASLVKRRGWLVRRVLLAADLTALTVAFLITQAFFGFGVEPEWWMQDRHPVEMELAIFFATLPGWIVVAKLYGLYRQDEERTDHSTADDLVPVFHMVTVGLWLFLGGAWLTQLAQPEFPKLLTFWFLAIVLVTGARVGGRALCRRHPGYVQNTLVVGAGEVGQLIGRKLLQHPEYRLNLAGFVDAKPPPLRREVADVPVLGGLSDLPSLIQALDIERVILAFGDTPDEEAVTLIHHLKSLDVQIDIVPRLFETVGPGADIHTVEGVPLIGLPPRRLSRSGYFVKRSIDIVAAAVGLVVTAPLFAVVAWKIKRESPGPVFFRQQRLGKNMREFTMLKFRTMRADTDDSAHREYIKQVMEGGVDLEENGLFKLDQREAVTPFGRWMRKTSLDELPQLVNVLRGEMSLVGPRPCMTWDVEHLKPHHFERFIVPPGLTGLWQVTARARSTWAEAMEMDVAYARGWSLGLDIRLLLRTPLQILSGRGAA